MQLGTPGEAKHVFWNVFQCAKKYMYIYILLVYSTHSGMTMYGSITRTGYPFRRLMPTGMHVHSQRPTRSHRHTHMHLHIILHIWSYMHITFRCWWRKSCTSLHIMYLIPLFAGFYTYQELAGFLPSAVFSLLLGLFQHLATSTSNFPDLNHLNSANIPDSKSSFTTAPT